MKNEITKTLKLFTEDFLYNYQFQFNDEEFRDEVKKGLDKICELFLKGGLIFLYKNICDKTNNSQYVIDLQMGVVDSYITFEEGGECIVLQYTIFKKGLIDIRESFVQENLPTNSHEDVRI